MMGGGDFDPPDEEDLDEPLSPQGSDLDQLADGFNTALGDAGEAAVQVSTVALSAWKIAIADVWILVVCAGHVEGVDVGAGLRHVLLRPDGALVGLHGDG